MTPKEIEAVKEIEGTAGFRVIQFLISEKMKKLDSVRNIDKTSNIPFNEQALGKCYAHELLETLFKEINLYTPIQTEKKNTYE